jgi:hypothetical protein
LEITTCVAFVAVTVSVDEVPAVIVAGLALIVTVGGVMLPPTETTTWAVAVPPAPVAVAVYVVVAPGVTDCVPPLPKSVYVVLSTLLEITT